ncbi:GntR family transcriptional regulator [Actinokineospora sp. NBRC 105648]|uniref:GntR family transcriptional regulator n=1 Tax=Actinokineospora sp. NBRC 105648 TaxID=3032206 RepID=UPI0024A51549|nr:GntR family transcriptional regulator [Actinokineospora sp. NBRC 105648]GLZ40856.1 GntR family transcriptional regulator [Actinokineospora sp. NBRC 105648]
MIPKWRRVQDDLVRRLRAGEFDVRFPSEVDLVAEYEVSRNTVRQALARLRAEGAVTAARGRRPEVRVPSAVEQPLGTLYSLRASVRTAGLTQRSTVRRLDVRADGVAAGHLGLDGSTPLVYLERLRLAGDEPLAIDRVWIPAEHGRCLLSADMTSTGVYEVLGQHCGLHLDRGQENIRAVAFSPAERTALATDVGLSIHRLSHAQGIPMEWRHTLVRGDRFTLTAHFGAP